MGISEGIGEIKRRIAAQLTSAASLQLVSVYLFGSWAEGRAHRESDVDLGVLFDRAALPTRKQRFNASLEVRAELGAALGCDRLDLVVLNDAPPLLARRIVTHGQLIYCGNLELDHVFVRDVQLRAADLAPYLTRMQQIKLEALAPR
jgi:predicted nucleotidyltransferase